MRWIIPVILIGVLLCCHPVSAEFYKYYDKDGNVHFTDDFNKVPPDQREQVKGYEESVSEESPLEETPAEADTAETQDEAEGEAEEESETAATEEYDLDTKVSEFDTRKAEMEQEYQSLVKEKERLDKMRKDIKTKNQAKGYNEDVKALNEKLQEHDTKRQALVSEIEQHNARLSEKKAAGKQKSVKKEEQD